MSSRFLLTVLLFALPLSAGAPPWHFEYSGGVPDKLVWQTEVGPSYYLYHSEDLRDWSYVPAFTQPGTGGPMEYSFTPGARGFFRVIAAPPAPEGFALIPAGSFQMGDQSDPLVGYSWELPVHSVYVSEFYMGRYEVTKELWDEVWAWGQSHGYTDLPTGSEWDASKGDDHPVHMINWYAVVKWCNARSQMENIAPCYTVGEGTYKTGESDAVSCDWNTNGFRLPSEAEWEKAARGGLSGRRFPWGDTIDHSHANYRAKGSAYSYDTSPYTNYTYHPTYNDGVMPYTSPVGSFAPNGYGLYNMAGNVWERCWDRWDPDYYLTSPGTDPRGPATGLGSSRVMRGSSWDNNARNTRCANRTGWGPGGAGQGDHGFRLARGQ